MTVLTPPTPVCVCMLENQWTRQENQEQKWQNNTHLNFDTGDKTYIVKKFSSTNGTDKMGNLPAEE